MSQQRSLDGILFAVVTILALGTAASLVLPGLQVRLIAPSLDLVLTTLTTVVTLSVAVFGWVRFRQNGEPVALFQVAAFLVLAIANGISVALVITGLDGQAGMGPAAPGQAPQYVFTVAYALAAALLVLGGIASLRARQVDHPAAILLGSATGLLLLMGLVQATADRLPSLASFDGPVLSGGVPGAALSLPSPTLLGASIQVLVGLLFLAAAGVSRRLYRRDSSIGEAYLAVGLVFAAYAQVAFAISPGSYAGLVTGGDLLDLAFDVILLVGIRAEAGAALARLRTVELENAGLDERARLARELHDGLSQELWVAKLKTDRLADLPDLGLEARGLVDDLDRAIDAGLAETRSVVAAMRLPSQPTGLLCELLAHSVEDFADRFGVPVEFACEAGLPPLSPRAQAESIRIAQEALSNVRRHADATVVRLRAGVEDERLVVVVDDNGRGFDPAAIDRSTYGLATMRERAALIGGELRIDSRPNDGTRVSLILPLPTTSPGLRADAR